MSARLTGSGASPVRVRLAFGVAILSCVTAAGCSAGDNGEPRSRDAVPPARQEPVFVPSDQAPQAPAVLPALPAGAFPAARPPELVMAVYEFAARHPEVLRYVPCFCGCERSGHHDNEDCFVRGRAADGQVTWDPHGAT